MELNINITIGATPELSSILSAFAKSFQPSTAEPAAEPTPAPTPETNPELATDPAATSEADAPAPQKTRRARKAKAEPAAESTPVPTPDTNPEPATDPAPASEASAPEPATSDKSDLPFGEEAEAPCSTPERKEMAWDTFREVLVGVRQRLLLDDGQQNAPLKRKFNKLVQGLAPYYGSNNYTGLTPANLYWAAAQVAKIELRGEEFYAPEPLITPEQVKEYKKAPFKE